MKKKSKAETPNSIDETVKTVSDGDCREKNGRFAVGNPGGPGRPPWKPRRFLRHVRSLVTADDIAAIVAIAIEEARKGDVEARRWLTSLLTFEPKLPRVDKKTRFYDEWMKALSEYSSPSQLKG